MHPFQEAERAKRDREAHGYDRFFPRWRTVAEASAILRRVEALRRVPRTTVVDLGTGTGRIPRVLAGHVTEVIGVDFSSASLEIARASVPSGSGTSYEWKLGDALVTGLPSECADVVTCAQVLQHMPTEEARDALLCEARRLLRPGGSLVLTCYGRNLLHRMRGGRESAAEGLYVYRHSCRDLRRRLGRQFVDVRVGALVGLPDFLPFPRLDRSLSHLPGFGLVGRSVLGSGRKAAERA